MTKLDGKAALVSGSGRGIGRAIALKLAAEGARLVVNDLDEGPAAETVAAIGAAGGAAVACNGDVTADDFPDRFVAAALDAYGAIDIIVNNAGYTWDSVIQKTSDAQWQAMIDVHLTAPFKIMRAASEFIRGAAKAEIATGRLVHRKVVNISSISGLYGNAGQASYGAAKAGLVGLTRSMCKEWGRYNVTSTASPSRSSNRGSPSRSTARRPKSTSPGAPSGSASSATGSRRSTRRSRSAAPARPKTPRARSI